MHKKFTLHLISHTFQEPQTQALTQLHANYKHRERIKKVGFRERERGEREGVISFSEEIIEVKRNLIMEVEKGTKMRFEETELRLGLPGNGGGGSEGGEFARKRGFSETVDLKLNLSSKEGGIDPNHENTRREKNLLATDPAKPPAK